MSGRRDDGIKRLENVEGHALRRTLKHERIPLAENRVSVLRVARYAASFLNEQIVYPMPLREQQA